MKELCSLVSVGISSVMMNSVGGTGEGVEHGWSLGVGGGDTGTCTEQQSQSCISYCTNLPLKILMVTFSIRVSYKLFEGCL